MGGWGGRGPRGCGILGGKAWDLIRRFNRRVRPASLRFRLKPKIDFGVSLISSPSTLHRTASVNTKAELSSDLGIISHQHLSNGAVSAQGLGLTKWTQIVSQGFLLFRFDQPGPSGRRALESESEIARHSPSPN